MCLYIHISILISTIIYNTFRWLLESSKNIKALDNGSQPLQSATSSRQPGTKDQTPLRLFGNKGPPEENKKEIMDLTGTDKIRRTHDVFDQQRNRPRNQHDLLMRSEHIREQLGVGRGQKRTQQIPDSSYPDAGLEDMLSEEVKSEIQMAITSKSTDRASFSNQMAALVGEINEQKALVKEKNKIFDQAIAYSNKNKWTHGLDYKFQTSADPFAMENTAGVAGRSMEDQDIIEPPFPKATLDPIEKIVNTFPKQIGLQSPNQIFSEEELLGEGRRQSVEVRAEEAYTTLVNAVFGNSESKARIALDKRDYPPGFIDYVPLC